VFFDARRHEFARKCARAAAEDHQDARPFPNDDAATELIWLALRNICEVGVHRVLLAAGDDHFAILFEGRFRLQTA
jgi:hypothetical protein